MTPIISLCIPTNGVIEWMFPALDSIYRQGVKEDIYEVVVTDNGDNAEFEQRMLEYASYHPNLHYYRVKTLPFMNEIEAYRRTSGLFIKYLNHRSLLREGTLREYIKFVKRTIDYKPIVYFSNGILKGNKGRSKYGTFDHFVRRLSYFSSWSTGMAFWKDDFERVDLDSDLNELFPHTKILFHERDRKEYIVDNRRLLDEQEVGTIPKGTYDLFYTFGVDYLGILVKLIQDGDISMETFSEIKDENLRFILNMHLDFVVRKIPCSYILSSFGKSMGVYYGKEEIVRNYLGILISRIAKRFVKQLGVIQ